MSELDEAEIERLGTEAKTLIKRMTGVNHALNLLGHSMSCGRDRTQAAAYDELIDAFSEMTSAWNARAELKAHGIAVESGRWGEDDD